MIADPNPSTNKTQTAGFRSLRRLLNSLFSSDSTTTAILAPRHIIRFDFFKKDFELIIFEFFTTILIYIENVYIYRREEKHKGEKSFVWCSDARAMQNLENKKPPIQLQCTHKSPKKPCAVFCVFCSKFQTHKHKDANIEFHLFHERKKGKRERLILLLNGLLRSTTHLVTFICRFYSLNNYISANREQNAERAKIK